MSALTTVVQVVGVGVAVVALYVGFASLVGALIETP